MLETFAWILRIVPQVSAAVDPVILTGAALTVDAALTNLKVHLKKLQQPQ
jgi:hypothetical protein